jgi:hypothetical protein
LIWGRELATLEFRPPGPERSERVTNAMRRLLRGAGALALAAALFADGGAVTDFGKLVPATVGAWRASGEDHVYDRQTLYDYMDGGAEVYLSFDFRTVWTRKYSGPDDREMTLDIYDMGSPAEAYGIFSCDRADPPAGIGQDSEYGYGLLRFRQGRYFVTITATDEDEGTGKTVIELGRAVLSHLGPPGPGPDMLAWLPADSLQSEKTSFFHTVVSLNNRYFLAADNILRLDRSTDCVLAEYAVSAEKPAVLLLVRYPDPSAAEAARRSFLTAYLPGAGSDGTASTDDKGWVSVSLHGACLAVVFDAPGAARARGLLSMINYPAK